jgi:hypothetical protein
MTSEFSPFGRILYSPLGTGEAKANDDLMENSGFSTSGALATLFDLEMKGMVRQLPGKQFLKVLL